MVSMVKEAVRDHPAPEHGPRRILVVDDEPRVARVIAHAAEACGCQAARAGSAAAFRALYDRDRPDVVLLDLSLPGGDGIELLRFLAERRAKCAIIIVSGFDGRVVEAAVRFGTALGLRMAGALTKPVTVRELEGALAAAASAMAVPGGGRDLCLG